MNIDKKEIIHQLNNSQLLSGLSIFLVTFASKFINFSPAQQKIFDNPIARLCIIFCIFYLSSKNVILSFSATAIFLIFWAVFLNDESRFNLIPQKVVAQATSEDQASYERAKALVQRYEEQQNNPNIVDENKQKVKDAYYATKNEVYNIAEEK